jgi:L-fuconolactonase
MLIADSQVHIWAASTPERPWPAPQGDTPLPHKPEPLTADLLLQEMKAAGVDRAVLVSPSFEGMRNDVVLAAAREHPAHFRAMGRIDPETTRDLDLAWLRQPGMLGLRFAFQRKLPRAALLEGRVDWLWPQAERAGVPLMLFVQMTDLHVIEAVAARHPGLRLTLDHLSLHEGKDEAAFHDLHKLLPLAKHGNVAVKASCLPLHTTDAYPFRRLHPWMRRVYDAFGPKRIFWGSDLSRLPCSYRQCVTMFTEELPWLSGADLEWIMGRGLCEWTGWAI